MNKKSHDNSDEESDNELEDVAVHKMSYWQINVHVHGKQFNIACGDASQRLKWLAHVAIARWDEEGNQGWRRLGIPLTVRHKKRDGEELDMSQLIKDILQNGDHIFVETSFAPEESG